MAVEQPIREIVLTMAKDSGYTIRDNVEDENIDHFQAQYTVVSKTGQALKSMHMKKQAEDFLIQHVCGIVS